ncbi:MAG: hypothetical protein ABSF23_08540 [Terracidiphilus sp.]|jgi:high-affinity Fe2+/Pb2+ permease
MGFIALLNNVAFSLCMFLLEGDADKNTNIIRIVAAVLAVVILVVLIQRRRTRVK